MNDNLRPCPFCVGKVEWHNDEACDGCHYITCTRCKCFVDLSEAADPNNELQSLEELQEAIVPLWNKRL